MGNILEALPRNVQIRLTCLSGLAKFNNYVCAVSITSHLSGNEILYHTYPIKIRPSQWQRE
jgi:hypothetical protein